MAKQFTTWSPSRLFEYEDCPRKAMHKHIDKMPDGEVDEKTGEVVKAYHLEHGTATHKAAELYIRGISKVLTKEDKKRKGTEEIIEYGFDLTAVRGELDRLKKLYKEHKVKIEYDLALTRAWKPTRWLANDVYVRLKIDVLESNEGTLVVTDWKTGRYKPDGQYDDQLQVYSVAALSAALGTCAYSRLCFTDNGKCVASQAGTVTKDKLEKFQKQWDARVKRMLTDTKFKAKPGNACRYCYYSTNKGGPCEF